MLRVVLATCTVLLLVIEISNLLLGSTVFVTSILAASWLLTIVSGTRVGVAVAAGTRVGVAAGTRVGAAVATGAGVVALIFFLTVSLIFVYPFPALAVRVHLPQVLLKYDYF